MAPEQSTTEPDYTTFDGYARAFLPPEHTAVIELGPDHLTRPSLVVKYGKYTAVIDLLPQTDHLCIDVHPFIDGEASHAGVIGMERGRQIELAAHLCEATVYGRPAVRLVSIVLADSPAAT